MSDSQWLDENTGYQGVPVWMTRKQCERILAEHNESLEVFMVDWVNVKGRTKFSFNSKQVFEWLGY
jgi:hypothetical protein